MELVYILPDKDAGVASVVRNLLKYKSNKFSTKVLLLHDTQDDPHRRIKDDFNADNIIRIKYNSYWHSNYQIAQKIAKHLNKKSFVISNDGGVELKSILLLKLEVPVIYILHGQFKYYFNCIKLYSNIINGIIAVSKQLQQRIKSEVAPSNSITKAIYLPVKGTQPIQVKKNCDKIHVVFVGTLLKEKGIKHFKAIFDDLKKHQIPYHFSIIGTGPMLEDLKCDFNNNTDVSFHGHLSNDKVFSILSNSDILILPSESEGLPVSIVEAMKAGVIPLASNIKSGIPELIEDGVTGYKINIGEEEKYASFIQLLYNNPSLRKEMSHNCVEFANTNFDPYKQAGAYEDFYQKVFNNFTPHKHTKRNLKKHILDCIPGFLRFQITKRLQLK